jgi:hypothetical protein
MTTENEPITIELPGLGKSFTLSDTTTALIWDAVKRGLASSPEEYIRQAFDRWYAREIEKSTEAAKPPEPPTG